jgi:hypothetical protein
VRQTVLRAKNKGALIDRYQSKENVKKVESWCRRSRAGQRPPLPTGSVKMGVAMIDVLSALELMRGSGLATAVADALKYYIERGILLADVHSMNLGEPMPGERKWKRKGLIITDPGHMVPLDRRWLEVRVPQLSE